MIRSLALLSMTIATSFTVAAYAENPKDDATHNPEDVVCKVTKVVDSKIPQRVCLTRFEWQDRRRAQMEAKRSSKNRNSYCGSGRC